MPRRAHRARGYLTPVQVDQLAREVAEVPTVIRFLAYTGLRWGEMAALKVSSFDMLRRRVNILEAVAEVDGRLVWSTTETHERRSVPFPRFLTDELVGLMKGKGRDALVFTGDRGDRWRLLTVRSGDKGVARGDGRLAPVDTRAAQAFPYITPHDLRHTAASLAISVGADVKAVQTMLRP